MAARYIYMFIDLNLSCEMLTVSLPVSVNRWRI